MSEILRDFYIEKSERFDIIVYESVEGTLNEIVNEVVKRNSEEIFPIKLIVISESEEKIKLNQSAVLIFDKCEAYQNFHKIASLNNFFPKDFHFLVYIKNFDEDRKKCLTTKVPLALLRYETFIGSEDEDSFKLTTFVTFQQPNCRNWQEMEVNQFSIKSRTWKSHQFFLEKFKNFDGCEVEVGFLMQSHPNIVIDQNSEGKVVNVWGIGINHLFEIEKQLNISVTFSPDGIRPESNVTLLAQPMRYKATMVDYDFCYPHITSEDLVLISRSVPYTQFEKMFLPFEIEVWVLLIVTLTTAVVTILIVKLTPKYVQKFVFGTNVRRPLMNLV